jgi:hypothetical protein
MNIKKQLFFGLLTLSSASLFCADEFKEKTSGTNNTQSSAQKTVDEINVNQDAIIAFMITTVKPIAKMGKKEIRAKDTVWYYVDNSSTRQCDFGAMRDSAKKIPDALDACILFKKNSYERKSKSLPSCLKIDETHYELTATKDTIRLCIKSGTLAEQKALFEILQKKSAVKFPEVTRENIKAKDFLEKRYVSYVELYSKATKPVDKQ